MFWGKLGGNTPWALLGVNLGVTKGRLGGIFEAPLGNYLETTWGLLGHNLGTTLGNIWELHGDDIGTTCELLWDDLDLYQLDDFSGLLGDYLGTSW